ncbi:MAG: DUF370 domain-containing protein [Dehalococcoidia bacterium]
MATELVHIGFGNVIAVNRVVALLTVEQQPTKRLLREAKETGLLIDATRGRKAKTAILFDTGHIILAHVTAETITNRLASLSASCEEKIELCTA